MAKKHWIYIKRGLSEDPKHRAAMGECIWLYMHIIDRADWETGIAYNWKDREEAADMGMNFETLRDQRQKLEKLDYIRCSQKQRGQDIAIMEWRNPREYASDVKNPRIQGVVETSPSEFQGDPHGDPHVSSQTVTPTLDSESESLREISDEANKTVDAILDQARKSEQQNKAKSWKLRDKFNFNEHVLALADKCVQRFGEPSKKDVTMWVIEIGSWVDAGSRVSDWTRAEQIVAGYTQPIISVTGMTKAIKFAAQERKNKINQFNESTPRQFPTFVDGRAVFPGE